MPTIPTYTARGQSDAVPRANTPRGGDTGLQDAAQSFGQLVQTSAKLVGVLQQEADKLEFATMRGEYDAGIKAIIMDLEKDPTLDISPEDYQAKFRENEQKLKDTIINQRSNERATGAFTRYTVEKSPVFAIEAKERGLKLSHNRQLGRLHDLRDNYSRLAASARTPAERDEYIVDFEGLVDSATQIGAMYPKDGAVYKESFREKVSLDQLKLVALADPDMADEMIAKGEFSKVDPVSTQNVMLTAHARKARVEAKAGASLRNAMKQWTESVEQALVQKDHDGSLTYDELMSYKDAISSEKLEHFEKRIKNREQGIGVGNREIEKQFVIATNDESVEPKSVLDQLIRAYNQPQPLVGTEVFKELAPILRARIAATRTESRELQRFQWSRESHEMARLNNARSINREAQTDIQRVASNRYSAAMSEVDDIFRVTGMFANLDQAAQEQRIQMKAAINRDSDHLMTGRMESASVILRREAMQRIPRVQVVYDRRVLELERDLKGRTMEQLMAKKNQMDPNEFKNQLRLLREYETIRAEKARLDFFTRVKALETEGTGERK